jgi:hypothetical protein
MAAKTFYKPLDVGSIEFNGVSIYFLQITVERARLLLSKNKNNRHIKAKKLDVLVSALLESKFLINGDTICFDINGRLVDGQHRLKAVIETGEEFMAVIVEGLSTNAMEVIDRVSPRRLRDALTMDGYSGSTILEGGINLVLSLDHLWKNDLLTFNKIITVQDGMEWFKNNRDIEVFSSPNGWIRTYYKTNFYCGLGFLFRQNNAETAREFFRILEEGHPEKDHPIQVLQDDIMETRKGTDRYQRMELLANSILAFNALNADELKGWTSTSLFSRDRFPKII